MQVQMPWFLPLALVVGTYLLRASAPLWQDQRHRRDAWGMVVLGAFPLLIWLIAQWIHQE